MLLPSKLPLGLGLVLLAAVNSSAAPSINVDMQAAFPAGPYLVELLETAAAENTTSYFPLLDRIASHHFDTATTDKDLYERFLNVLHDDGHITNSGALSTFKLALSTRSAAPRIEAHYQYYETAVEPRLPEGTLKEGCEQWTLLGGKHYCSPTLENGQDLQAEAAKTLPFDRILGSGEEAVLYADPASPAFAAFHKTLAEKARRGELSYKLRYRRASGAERKPLPVSGYGVELALKRTDYIVIDDREADAGNAQKLMGTEVDLNQDQEVADLTPLSTSELAPLGLKAASFVMQSQDPFDSLIKLTQDFPKFSASIAAREVSEDFETEHRHNRMNMVPPGVNALWINGLQLNERQIQPFTLVDMLRRERKLVHEVRNLGFSGEEAVAILSHPKVAEAKSDDGPLRFDWRDEKEGGQAIMWLNDLENDERYKELPSQLTSLLQRTMPGQLPPIRRDIFNLIVPVNFTNAGDIEAIATLHKFVTRLLPVRFGLVPIATTQDEIDQAKIAMQVLQTYGSDVLNAYLQTCVSEGIVSNPSEDAYYSVISEAMFLEDQQPRGFEQVFESEELVSRIDAAQKWVKRLNAGTPVPPIFIDGLALPRDKNWLQAMSMQVTRDLQLIQQAVFTGAVEEDEWVAGRFLEVSKPGRNQYIYPENGKTTKILSIEKVHTEHRGLFDRVPFLENGFPMSAVENMYPLTVVADLTSAAGKELIISALQFGSDGNHPLHIVHNPQSTSSAGQLNLVLKQNSKLLENVQSLEDLQDNLDMSDDMADADADADASYAAVLMPFLSATGIEPGSNVVIYSGRVVGPIAEEDTFDKDDFAALSVHEMSARILPVLDALDELQVRDKLQGHLASAKLASIVALSTVSDLPEGIFESTSKTRVNIHDEWTSTHTAIEVGDSDSASIHLVGLLNPVSEQGQRWAPILKVLSELDGVYLKLFLNPRDVIDELPVKRFFRYVLNSEPTFDEATGEVQALGASFRGLPSEALLTAGMNMPPAWLVAPKASVHDLDNIKLSSIKAGGGGNVEATYELQNILIEGHSREKGGGSGGAGQPPRGAQLVLGTESDRLFADTIIMANLGYFQFKANPGLYDIQLKEGRSSEIYDVESVGARGWSAVPGDEGSEVALMDFQGTTLYPRLKRRPGQENADVLKEIDETNADKNGGQDSLLSQGLKFAEGLFGGTSNSNVDSLAKSLSVQEHAEINVFSVASGHLYERMLNIMMVSVMKNTQHTVKFWFIEQFLSPSFKEFIPHLAAEYGFRYEMVTFKWPHWLRAQKEKQREIWGYKILFLDVLFPLSLDKVIFVDADQVVRTDLADLVTLPLDPKAPYGFAPMCDSREDMEGFRFWKQGYWANYLRGKPYHISALYVVDLRRFRDMGAGDRLRQTYHSLSADPNSLANLDQDLPNHMQFTIPIHSLPQEWLWCETWCSDESLNEARTIDLCNNPQTKEPKLDRARRQVPEWTVYDEEIAEVDRRRRGIEGRVEGEGEGEAVAPGAGDAQDETDENVQKNPKSRNWEEPPAAESAQKKDEL